MRRYCFLMCPLLLNAAFQAYAAKKPEPQPVPSFESNVRVVLLDVVVTDSKGNPVTGLRQDDFRVFEDGKPQKITSFQEHRGAPVLRDKLPPLPKNTYTNYPTIEVADSINVILMDSLNTPIQDGDYAHQQVIKYLKTIPPGARVAIFTLSSRLRMIQDFTTDSSTLLAVLNRMGAAKFSPLMQSDAELRPSCHHKRSCLQPHLRGRRRCSARVLVASRPCTDDEKRNCSSDEVTRYPQHRDTSGAFGVCELIPKLIRYDAAQLILFLARAVLVARIKKRASHETGNPH